MLAVFIFFQKLELAAPGSISMILIPNGSNSYCIDLNRPSRANLVPTYAEITVDGVRIPSFSRTIYPMVNNSRLNANTNKHSF